MVAFNTLFRCSGLTDGSRTLNEMADKLEEAAKRLREMNDAGVTLDGVVQDDYAELATDDKDVAELYGLLKQDDDEQQEEEDQ